MSLFNSLTLFVWGFTFAQGEFTKIGNVEVNNEGCKSSIIDDTIIIEFANQCYTGKTPQERADELIDVLPCLVRKDMNGRPGFIEFKPDIDDESDGNSYFLIAQINDYGWCINDDIDLSNLCINSISNDFTLDDETDDNSYNDINCMGIDVFPNNPHIEYSWALDQFDGFDLGYETYRGNNEKVDIYVVELGGIDVDHEDFYKVENLFLWNGEPYSNSGNHGTFVASVVAGRRYGSVHENQLIYNVHTGYTWSGVVMGLQAVTEHLQTNPKRSVINMSFGGIPSQTEALAIYRLIKRIIKLDGVPVAAAGNENEKLCDYPTYPPFIPDTIAVGNHNINYLVRFSSNYDECVDIYGPGTNVRGAMTGNQYGTNTGTSFAAPYVAGIIVNYLLECEKTGFTEPCTLDNINKRLKQWTVDVGPSPFVDNPDQCGSTGVPCKAVQYHCGRPLWPLETSKCEHSPCAEYESGICDVYNEGSGCSQCGWSAFKISDNYPCKLCNDIMGPACLFCQNYQGCGQCIDENNYHLVNDYNTGLRYCKPQPCLNPNNNCKVCNNGECSQCEDGYLLRSDKQSCYRHY